MTFAEFKVDAVVLACAVSAGIHAALAPAHFAESAGAGVGFTVATVLLAGAAVAVTLEPSPLVALSTLVLFAGLIVSYAFAATTGVPLIHPEQEAVDGLALFTKAVEVLGLVLAASLVPLPARLRSPQPKGVCA
jgi:hypothetical protein